MASHDPSTVNELNPQAPPQPPPASLAWSKPSAGEVRVMTTQPSAAGNAGDAEIEPLRTARRNATTAFERKYLEAVLSRSQGSIARAAALSKVSRQMLQKLMRKHGLSMPR
jgi:DNA-binding NtrC family response regulator